MKDKIRASIESPKGMGIVNLLFFLLVFIRNRGIIFLAYTAWIIYLVYSIKTTPYKAVKIINGILILVAAAIIAVNLYFMFQYIN